MQQHQHVKKASHSETLASFETDIFLKQLLVVGMSEDSNLNSPSDSVLIANSTVRL